MLINIVGVTVDKVFLLKTSPLVKLFLWPDSLALSLEHLQTDSLYWNIPFQSKTLRNLALAEPKYTPPLQNISALPSGKVCQLVYFMKFNNRLVGFGALNLLNTWSGLFNTLWWNSLSDFCGLGCLQLTRSIFVTYTIEFFFQQNDTLDTNHPMPEKHFFR